MVEIPESDWKVLRRVHRSALEVFCERVMADMADLARETSRSAHERYLDIYKLIREREREMARLFDNPRRSQAFHILSALRVAGLLPDADFADLSPATREAVELMLDGARFP